MDATITLILGLAVGVVLGVVLGVLISRARRTVDGISTDELISLRERVATAEATAASRAEQIVELHEQRRTDQQRTEADHKVLQQMAPLQEMVRQMSGKIAEFERERATQFGVLTEQLTNARRGEQQLLTATHGLTSALTNHGSRGMWGEIQLRRLVEMAGLLEHVDFAEQETVRSDAGNGRIDLVVRLSDGKRLAIDAKVPLDKYLEASNIPITATGVEAERRIRLMNEHAKAMRAHVDALAKREYWNKLDVSPDFVIGFIPSESLLGAALEADPTLFDYAFRKNVALASPVSLWAVLKTVGYSWRQEALSKDAKRIFDLATELYSRVRTVAEHAEALRRSIESTVNNYNKFSGSFESRVLVTARKINENGDPSLEIPESGRIETTPRALSAPEIVEVELAALDETGIARTELDLGLIGTAEVVNPIKKPKTA